MRNRQGEVKKSNSRLIMTPNALGPFCIYTVLVTFPHYFAKMKFLSEFCYDEINGMLGSKDMI